MSVLCLFVGMLFSCKDDKGIENPYFEDTSESTMEDFKIALDIYMTHIEDYYKQSYWTDYPGLTYVNDMPSDFESLEEKTTYTKEETMHYDAYLNQFILFHDSSLLELRRVYQSFLFTDYLYDDCKENQSCTEENLYFSIHGDQLYVSMVIPDDKWTKDVTIYFDLDDDNKINLTFTYHEKDKNTSTTNLYRYANYVEGQKETNITFQYGYWSYYIHDLSNGDRIKWRDGYLARYDISFYDNVNHVGFMGTIDLGEYVAYNAIQYENGHEKLIVESDYVRYIGMNHVSGWDTIRAVDPNSTPFRDFYLYDGDQLLHEALICRFLPANGSLVLNVMDPLYREIPLEDIISLHYFGLESGITLDDVESLPTTAIELAEQKLEFYGLDIGKLALYEKFENITGKHFE
jgi:hypothetical protein